MKNYYKILGVKKNASEEEIRARWIKLIQKLHPDQRIEEGEDERLKEINQAYQVLKHSSTRVEYDLKRRSYLRKKRGLYLKRLPLPVSISIVVLILGTIYFRKPHLPIQDTSLTQNQTSQIDRINQRNEINQTDQINEIIPVPKSEKPVKVQKIVPKDLNKIPPKEFKEVKPQEMVKLIPEEIEKVEKTELKIIEHPMPSVPGSEGELKSKEKLSTQTVLKSEISMKVEKVVPKEISKEVAQEVVKAEETKQSEQEVEVVPPIPLSQTSQINQKDQRAVRSEKPIPKESIKVEETKPPEQEMKIVSAPVSPQKDQIDQRNQRSQIAKEEEVRQFLGDYLKKYTQKDIDGFLSLFSLKAIQNQKEGFEGIRKIYVNFFNQSEELRYSMEDVKIEIYQNAVEVKARYEVDQIMKKRGKKKVWKGDIRWVLAKENGPLKILSLDYQHQKSL